MAHALFSLPNSPSRDEDVGRAVTALRGARAAWRRDHANRNSSALFPEQSHVAAAVELLCGALFPRRLGGFKGTDAREDAFVAGYLHRGLSVLHQQVSRELGYWQAESQAAFDPDQPTTIVRLFAAALGEVRSLVDSDVRAAFLGDPAARSVDEILISYPGALAVLHHRLAHELYKLGAPIIARIISELANSRTGIDIHPGATIGPSFFIDHGTGVVIGETAIIGARVQLYQHVTLGARSPLGKARLSACDRFARHPVVEDDVVIYAGATILGRVTIGRGSTISGNVWLLDDVPPGSIVAQPEARVLHDAAAEQLHDTLLGNDR